MRKKTFLKAVSIFVCFSILMLSVPGVIASERTVKRSYTDRLIAKTMTMLFAFLPFLNMKANNDKDTTSVKASVDDSSQKTKITGTLSSVRKPNTGDGEKADN